MLNKKRSTNMIYLSLKTKIAKINFPIGTSLAIPTNIALWCLLCEKNYHHEFIEQIFCWQLVDITSLTKFNLLMFACVGSIVWVWKLVNFLCVYSNKTWKSFQDSMILLTSFNSKMTSVHKIVKNALKIFWINIHVKYSLQGFIVCLTIL